jgi:AcrR family transcriptional regulator
MKPATGPAKAHGSRARLAALPPERRALLLDPAEREFTEHGFEGASLNRILAEAGMSKGQAYYYVSGKADLYRAVIERALERLIAAIDFHFSPPTSARAFWRQIEDFLVRFSMVLMGDERLATLARSIYSGGQSDEALTEPIERIRTQIGQLIQLGQSVGAIRRDLPQDLLTAIAFGAARETDRWFAIHWPTLDSDKALKLNAEVIGMFKTMLKPRRNQD